MSVIQIPSDQGLMHLTCTWAWRGSGATPSTKKQILSFDLSALGLNPTITNVELNITSTRGKTDTVLLYVGSEHEGVSMPGSVIAPAFVRDALTGSTLEMTIEYYGNPGEGTPLVNRYFNTDATFTLVVTIEGAAPVTDKRSSGSFSVTSLSFGGTARFTVTPFSEDSTHTITYTLGTHTTQHLMQAGDTEDDFDLPMAWLDALPKATSGKVKAVLDTLEDGVSVGTKEYTLKVKVQSSVKPKAGTLTAQAVNTGALASSTNYFKGASMARLTLTGAAAGQGSSIASITYSGWGDSAVSQETSHLTPAIHLGGEITLQAVVTDGRGRTATATVTITVYDYTAPYFESISVSRCDPDGTPNDKGAAVMVNASFGCATDVFPDNVATASIAFREQGTENWSAEYGLQNGTDTLINQITLDETVSYEMRFTVTDKAMSSVAYMTLPSTQFVIHFGNGGRSVGIGRAARSLEAGQDGRLDVNEDWDVYLGANIYIGGQTLAAYIQSVISGT